MILINSGAYLTQELQAEFGSLPACFIPLANKKLIEFQAPRLRAAFPEEEIVVSLPESYSVTAHEQSLLERLAVSSIVTPDNFNLAEALLYILNTIAPIDHLRMLHGDTLFDTFPSGLDLIDIAISRDNYNWTRELASGEDYIWTGYFAFSSPRDLARCLALGRGNFVGAIRQYMNSHLMTMHISTGWMDMGHVNTYFKARATMTTQRAFNALHVDSHVVKKSGNNPAKIAAEANWFKSIPPVLKKYIPQLIASGQENGQEFYQLEYLPLSPLNELFVHGKSPLAFWTQVFEQVRVLFDESRITATTEKNLKAAAERLYIDKTRSRLEEFIQSSGLRKEQPLYYAGKSLPSLEEICADCFARVAALPCIPCVLHGDLCLSNMLIDLRSDGIKLIDPRGMDAEQHPTIEGDQKYDLAKLTHSIIGLYDFIVAGYYTLSGEDFYSCELTFPLEPRIEAIQQRFWNERFIPGVYVKDCLPLTVLLFLSMLPLHGDDVNRQRAFFANALRLYATYCDRRQTA
jgi:fructosamine-3-kinase